MAISNKKAVEGMSSAETAVKTIVKPVANAIAILRCLADGNPRTVTQIARDLEINTSTCFNILRTLASEMVILFDQTTKTYKIGPAILQIASTLMSEGNRLMAARPILAEFANKHHVSICVWRRVSPLRNVLVDLHHGSSTLRIDIALGQSLPTLLGSTGRAMALHLGLTKEALRKEVEQLRWYRKPSFEEYWKDAQLAHKRGWAKDSANFTAGVTTVSAPVVTPGGSVQYSLTALMFDGQFDADGIEQLGSELARVAASLATVLS